MNTTFTETVILEMHSCGKCGGVFALNKTFTDYSRECKGGFHCPYCQEGWGWWESEAERLRKQLESKSRELVTAKCEALKEKQLRESAQIAREISERKLGRIKNGVCPCCKRSFQNLRRHMKTKHPERSWNT